LSSDFRELLAARPAAGLASQATASVRQRMASSRAASGAAAGACGADAGGTSTRAALRPRRQRQKRAEQDAAQERKRGRVTPHPTAPASAALLPGEAIAVGEADADLIAPPRCRISNT
jgi:hypothetical protein